MPKPENLSTATSTPVGQPLSRVDGRAKVTGKATYAAEAPMPGMAHAVIVQSEIARGEITAIDTAAAERAPGVLAVLTPKNMPKLRTSGGSGLPAERIMPLADMKVHYAGQHIAVAVADTLERAQQAARLIKVAYAPQRAVIKLDDPNAKEEKPKRSFAGDLQGQRGNVDQALAADGLTVVKQTYITPVETHNPMEMSATTAVWEGEDHLTVWDSTQHIVGRRDNLATTFGLKPQNVRVLSLFVGGGFGCKGAQWPHAILAAAAAKVTGKPVRLMLTRQQMFTSCGHRPPTEQTLTLAAAKDGKLTAIQHDSTMHGSTVGDYVEACGSASSRMLYDTPNLRLSHTIRRVDVGTPTFMRAPGEAPGVYALESALDELAVALNMDPVQLRLINHADKHPQTGQPWSGKFLKDCYKVGIEKFGWEKRNPKVGSMRLPDGRLIGWGMATATYPAHTFPGTARIRLMPNGSGGLQAVGAAATHDLGTGAYTAFTQITAEQTGLPIENVKFELGDSALPPSGVTGGSATTASVGQALSEAATALKAELLKIASADSASPLAGLKPEQVVLAGNRLIVADEASKLEDVAALLAKSGRPYVEGSSGQRGRDEPEKVTTQSASGGEAKTNYAFQSFGAHFVEVIVDEPVPMARVNRVVSVMDVGRVINPKTTRSQVMGGVVMGIGMALMEETLYDPNTGRPVTDNLADYPVCVNPDIHTIETYFVGEPDFRFNAIGCRGVGEIGITGVAAAVANAVYHATGRRVRDLPITPDKLL